MNSALLDDIARQEAPSPVIWWLGHCGFVLKYRQAILYVDPLLSGWENAPIQGSDVEHASLILCTHSDPDHFDPDTVRGILSSSKRAKLVIPKSQAGHAHALGISLDRMVTTDSDLRVEFFDDRIYAVPSAHPELDRTAIGGYPYLGYLIRFGGCTIYHAGDCLPYEGLAGRLRPYNVTVALLPINGRPWNFEPAEAAQLAEEIGSEWIVPMHYGVFPEDADAIGGFVDHMLGHRPSQKFKVFEVGEKWLVPR